MRILCRNPYPTGIEVADTQHHTADNDQRTRTEGILLGTEDRRFDDIECRFESTVCFQRNLSSEVVGFEGIMRLKESEFPRVTRKTDRTDRCGTCTAVPAGDDDLVGIGFRHTGCNGSDTGSRYEFDRDLRIRINLLHIEDQLCQIFDGIDIMVRRR